MASMRREELDRRCAEMKARMLAQRAARVKEQPLAVSARKSATKSKRDHDTSAIEQTDNRDAAALRKQIARLEAENKRLRDQITALTSREARPSRTADDSVRDQRHNFFKYSNVRRY